MKHLITLLIAAAWTLAAQAQRISASIDEGWQFKMSHEEGWQAVSLPHTWNAADAFDDTPGYLRGTGIYRRTLTLSESQLAHRLYLRFEGAQTVAKLIVNGHEAGTHVGGYTAFCFDITPWVHAGENGVEVQVDNSYNADIPPLSADFTFYGGIYRDVMLLELPAVHISPTHYASSGIYVNTPEVTADRATIEVRTLIDNTSDVRQAVVVEHQLYAPDGQLVAQWASKRQRLDGGTRHHVVQSELSVNDPALWDIDHPQLYRLRTRLVTPRGALIDQTTTTLGLRSYTFSTSEGFVLNGRQVKLVGTNRHQDYYGMGNALADEMHTRDIEMIKQMGANFLRISHYPQDPLVTDACDRLGIVTSVEIPVINTITMSQAFSDNCAEMLTEMICQSYNAPSVCIWAFMNEILLVPAYNADRSIDRQQYLAKVREVTQRMHDLAKQLDPARYTLLPCHTAYSFYQEAGLFDITDILGFNNYDGWYQGEFADFERVLEQWHERYPDKPFFISEYGADNDVRVHSFEPRRFDYSEEYANLFHRHYLPAILERRYIVGSAVWNYNDFGSESRGYAVPHTNLKGLVTTTRQPKDSYRYYQAMLLTQPVLAIGGHDWTSRSDVADADGRCLRPVTIYTNQPQVTLTHNGTTLGTQKTEQGTCEFMVPFTDGSNRLVATAGALTDVLDVGMRLVPHDLGQFRELNVLLGSRRHYLDPQSQLDWMPEQAYTPGSWGYVGGQAYSESNWAGELPTSSLNILGTDHDPLYQTQRRALEQFRADLPDGEYVIYLHFCELDGATRSVVASELGGTAQGTAQSPRAFEVRVNGESVLPALDVAACCGGPARPMVRRIPCSVHDGQGLVIDFVPLRGETMLSAVRILRL